MTTPEKRLLLIDDNLLFSDKLKHVAEAGGYAPRPVMFEAALEPALAEGPPAAVVVNLDADRFDALAMVRRLRGRGELAKTPIIAFCGHVHAELMDAGREAGATEIVSNGAIASVLPRLLQKHVEGGGGPDAAGGLDLDYVE